MKFFLLGAGAPTQPRVQAPKETVKSLPEPTPPPPTSNNVNKINNGGGPPVLDFSSELQKTLTLKKQKQNQNQNQSQNINNLQPREAPAVTRKEPSRAESTSRPAINRGPPPQPPPQKNFPSVSNLNIAY